MPSDREQRLLHTILKDSQDVLRLILLLLSDVETSVSEWTDLIRGNGNAPSPNTSSTFPLLETLLKALDRDPDKLDEVNRLIDDLRKSPEGINLIPPGFEDIWDPIWAVRQEMSDG